MSTIKNLVKTFKERQGAEMNPPNAENAENTEGVGEEQTETLGKPKAIETKVVNKKLASPKKTAVVAKESKTANPIKIKNEEKAKSIKTVMPNMNLTDDFFASLNEESFSYEKSKFAYIDKKIYEVLMTLKRKKDVKNISSLINAALSQFIEQNKDDIRNIFMDDLL